MASIIRIKRSSGILAPATLKTAELAYAYGTGTTGNQGDRLFVGKGDDGTGQATSVVVIGGSYFTDMLDHNPGLLRTNSAIIVDSDKKIEELKSGNIHIDGFNDKIIGLVAPTDSSGATTKRYVDSAISDTRSYIDSEILAAVYDSTGVVGGTYGGATSIPIITVDNFGRIDSVGTSPLSTTLNISADSGTADSVDLINDTLNFSGSTGIITKVVDSGIDIRLDSTGVQPGVQFGGGSSLPRITVDAFGRATHIDQTNILAELTIKDDITANSPTEHRLFTTQNDLVIKGGNSINVTMSGPTHSQQGVADYTDGVFEISVDSSSLSSIDSVGWMAHERYPGNPQNYQIIGSSALEILTSDGTIHSAPIKYFRDSANFQEVIRPHGGIRMGLSANIEFGNTTVYGPSATEEYNGPSGSTLLTRYTSNTSFGNKKGFNIYDDDGIRLHTNNIWLQTYDRGYGSGHDSTANNSSNNIFLGGHLVAKTINANYGPYDIGEDSSYTWRNAYFTGTVKAGNLVLTSGGISVDSGGNVEADSAKFDTLASKSGYGINVADSVIFNNDENLVFGSGYTWNSNPVPGRTTMRHDTTDHYFEFLADSHTTEAEFAAKNITLIAYDPAYDFRSGFGGLSGVGNISLDGNVVPALGRGSSLYNQGYRRDLGASGTRFGTVYVDSVDRGHYVDSGTYGSASAIPVFTVNKTGFIDSIGTVPVAGVDSASWDNTTNTLNITTGDGTIHDVEIDYFGDSVTFAENVNFGTNKNLNIPAQTYLNFNNNRALIHAKSSSADSGALSISASAPMQLWATKGHYLITYPNLNGGDSNVNIGGNILPYRHPTVSPTSNWDIGIDSSYTWNNAYFMGTVKAGSFVADNIKIDGNTISSTDSSNQLFIDPFPVGDSGDLVVRGNLIVQGTQTTVNSTVVSLNDKNLVLADSATTSATADGAGLTVGGDQFDSTATKPQFVFDAATYRWDPNLPIDIPFVSLDSAVFLNGVALREVMEDHLDNFFGVDSNNAVTITYDDVANTMTWKGTDASTTQKGVSSFDSSNFTITAGHVAVTVLDGGTW